MAIRLIIADSAAETTAAREVEGRVFLEAFGNTPQVMEQEYGPYDDRSRFVVVLDDADGSALGAVRLILPDATGEVKTLTDVAGAPWQLSAADTVRAAGFTGPVWDVASLAVDPWRRRGPAGAEVTLALCHGLYRYSRDSGAEGLVTILDDRVLRLLRVLGVPWAAMAGATSQYYLGSPASTPCIVGIEASARNVRAQRPNLAAAIVDGVFRTIALDPADLLPSRGVRVPEVVGRRPERPSLPTVPRTGWRPPAYRRAGALEDGQRPAAG